MYIDYLQLKWCFNLCNKKGESWRKKYHNELLELEDAYENLVISKFNFVGTFSIYKILCIDKMIRKVNDYTIKKEELEEVWEIQKRRNTFYDIKFINENSKIALTIKDIPLKPFILINEMKHFKCKLHQEMLISKELQFSIPWIAEMPKDINANINPFSFIWLWSLEFRVFIPFTITKPFIDDNKLRIFE